MCTVMCVCVCMYMCVNYTDFTVCGVRSYQSYSDLEKKNAAGFMFKFNGFLKVT